MKKIFISFIIIVAFIYAAKAQNLVSTQVQKKNAILEEFTGIHCGYCPQGHQISQEIKENNPNRVVVINIHQGPFANPGAGEPNYKTPFGDPIAAQAGGNGYPHATVNRHIFPNLTTNNNTALSRGQWNTASTEILDEISPVNVGASTSYNSSTRELTVNVELFYTSDSPESTNFINVAIIQSGIFGPQSGGGSGSNYEHKHMLRHLITDTWGEEISTTNAGSFIQKTYTYTLPEDYNDVPCVAENCDIAVFVTESHQEIYTGCEIPLIDGTTLITSSISHEGDNLQINKQDSTSTFNLNIANLMPANEDFILTLEKINEPIGWNSFFTIDGNSYDETTTINLAQNETKELTIDVTSNDTLGVAKYIFKVKSSTSPNAMEITQTIYVMSKVENLLIHNQGSWATGSPVDFEQQFFDAFDNADLTSYISCDYPTFRLLGAENKLDTIDNIYFNVSWSFPAFTNESVEFFSNYLDNGGNLFVSGQDIGWDTWAPEGNGTAETQAFYTNYLCADYNNDGTSSNNSVYAVAGDEYFGNIADFNLSDIYGGNMYPDEIDAIGVGTPIFYYNNNTSNNCAVKSSNGTYKTVYLGFDYASTSEDAKNNIIQATKNFFDSQTSIIKNEIENKNIHIYPNPCSAELYISTNNSDYSNIEIFNTTGKCVFKKNYKNKKDITINTSNFSSGIYLLKINNISKKFIVK